MDSPECVSEIAQFYSKQSVFITGATGFMGKVLTEKLLRSCEGIDKIYLLVRPKKNANIQERMNKFLTADIFDELRNIQPNFQDKIVGIEGDCGEPNLGISEENWKLLTRKVSIIFHLAATTRFDEKLEIAIPLNVISVKQIIDLSKQCKNFKVGVYCSTAYSNCVVHKIDEKFYDPPLNYKDAVALAKILTSLNLSDEDNTAITKKLIGKWPNTYTFTKAIAESVVAEYAKDLPFAVTRPPIVMSTYQEPIPGWTNNLLGPTGLVTGIGLGVIHTVLVNKKKRACLVPCDMACQALIACAWDTGTKLKKPDEPVPVYNFVCKISMTWEEFRAFSFKALLNNPSVYIIYFPYVIMTESESLFKLQQFFLQCIPAIIFDKLVAMKGKKGIMYKIYDLGMKHSIALKLFSTQEWDFENTRFSLLWNKMNKKDKEIFYFYSDDFDWNDYFKSFVVYLKKYYVMRLIELKLFRPKDDSIEKARRHFRKLRIIHYTLTTILFIFFIWILYNILYGSINYISSYI